MIGWLWRMIVGRFKAPSCSHTWQVTSKGPYEIDGLLSKRTGTMYHLQCKQCGEIMFKTSKL